MALALTARLLNWVRPTLCDEPVIALEGARHPIVCAMSGQISHETIFFVLSFDFPEAASVHSYDRRIRQEGCSAERLLQWRRIQQSTCASGAERQRQKCLLEAGMFGVLARTQKR